MKVIKNLKNIILKLLLVFVLVAPTLKGAEENIDPLYRFGFYGGYNLNIHYADFVKLPGIPNCCEKFTGGTGGGFALGGLFEYPIMPKMMLGLRIGYATIGAELTKDQQDIGNTQTLLNGVPVKTDILVKYNIDSKIDLLSIEPIVSYNFFDKFNGYLGFRLGYALIEQFDQQEKILSPSNVTYSDGRIIQNERVGLEIPEKNSILFHGILGVGYDLPIGKSAILEPMINYYLPFNNISSVDWKPSTWLFGLAVHIPIYPTKELPIKYDTIYHRDTSEVLVAGIKSESIKFIGSDKKTSQEETSDYKLNRTVVSEHYQKSIPKVIGLETSVEVYGITKDGGREKDPKIVIEEIDSEEGFPLLPHVFFKEGSDNLTLTDLHFLKRTETDKFREDSLESNTMIIYAELLNIAGYRLRKNPYEVMTITGCNSNIGVEANNLALSQSRAEAVKKYLVNVWGIEANRITTIKQNLPDNPGNPDNIDGIVENQRAELKFKNIDLLKPVYIRQIARKSNPPVVDIVTNINTQAGVKKFNVLVEQSGNEIRNYSGDVNPASIEWNVEIKPVPELETPVNITLTVEDKAGQISKASTSLKLQQLTIKKKRYELKDDKRIERYFLIVFDFNKAEVKLHHRPILSQIKSRIMPNSKVTISGYADRTGELEYNSELAKRRCMEVQKALQVKEAFLTINPVGSKELLYDNDLPQGRSYSRTVQITIETPVK